MLEILKNNISITQQFNPSPKYKYMFWDEILILKLISGNKYLTDKYYKYIYLHQKVDFIKLVILYKYGGIMLDMDAHAIKSLDSLFLQLDSYDFVVSKLTDLYFYSNYVACGKFSQCVNNGNYIAKPKADILLYLINNLKTDCGFIDSKTTCIHKTTGPSIFNELIDKYINMSLDNKSKIKFLPNDVLEPCIIDMCTITPNTHVIHKHELSWHNSWLKQYYSFIYRYQLIFIIGLFVILYLIFRIRYKI